MTTPTVTAAATVANGKATIAVTSVATNADGSVTETVNTSAPLTKAQVTQLQAALQAQIVQQTAQITVAQAKLTAIAPALANSALL